MDVQLVDRIYEAAILPDLWPEVLRDLCGPGGGDGALMFTTDGRNFQSIASPGFGDLVAAYVAEGWPARTDRAQRLFARKHAGFLVDLDVYTPDEHRNEPVFRDFLRPRGFGWGTATAIEVPTGDSIVFDVERRDARGPVPPDCVAALDQLRPHLTRAATISTRLKLRTVQATAEALDLVGLPAAVLGRAGKVLATNARFEELRHSVVRDAGRLALCPAGADGLLAGAIDRLSHEDVGSVRSIPIAADRELTPMVLHLIPIRRAARDLFAAATALAVFTPVPNTALPGTAVIGGLFDLTPAEARVARAIAACVTVEQAADTFGVAQATIRSHLKSVLMKMGLSRQSELVAMLSGIGLPG